MPPRYLGLVPSAELELQSETCVGHPLHNVICRVVAWNSHDVNEFLYVTENPEWPIAFVHLTFCAESLPEVPFTVGYKNWNEFRADWTRPDTRQERPTPPSKWVGFADVLSFLRALVVR